MFKNLSNTNIFVFKRILNQYKYFIITLYFERLNYETPTDNVQDQESG